MTDLTFDPAALRALLDAATPGPWTVQFAFDSGGHEVSVGDVLLCYSVGTKTDAELIAALRNQGMALLDALAAVRMEHAGTLIALQAVTAERDLANEQLRGWRKRAAEQRAVPTAAPQADGPCPHGRDSVCPECGYELVAVPGDGEQAATTCPACGHGINWHWDDNGQRDGAPGCHKGDCACSNTRASVNRLTATALPTSRQA